MEETETLNLLVVGAKTHLMLVLFIFGGFLPHSFDNLLVCIAESLVTIVSSVSRSHSEDARTQEYINKFKDICFHIASVGQLPIAVVFH